MTNRPALVRLSVILALAPFSARPQSHASTRDGVYTEAQASRGQAAYKAACASCHKDALEGSGAATPALTGPGFIMNWSGQTLGDLFDTIQTQMPADHPGTLSRSENADILAYILQFNKLPAGRNDLPASQDALAQIRFEPPKEAAK